MTTLKRVGVDNKAIASLVAGMLSRDTRTVEGEANRVQIIDQWADAEDYLHLQGIGSVTLPVLAAGIGWRTVLSYIVPTGKIFIPEWVSCNGAGTLNALARVSHRYHLWAFSGAALANPTANATGPSISAGASVGMNIGVYSYKWTILNNVGETLPTAASANVTTTAATDGITVPLPTVPAGGCYIRIYRTVAGGSTYFLLHELDGAVGGYTDTHPDADLNQAVTPPGANTTAGSVSGLDNPPLSTVAEIVFHVVRLALSASPTAIIYTDEDGLQERTTTTVTVTIDTQTQITLKRADLGFTGPLDAIPRTKAANFRGGNVNHGLREMKGVQGNPATGQYNIYGYHPVLRGEIKPATAAPVAGAVDCMCLFRNPVAFPAGAEVTVDLVHPQGITAAAGVRAVDLVGRLINA
jgi:hypothetical protein